jgi:hypothetical protein
VVSNVIERGYAALGFVGCVDCAAVNNTVVDSEHWIVRILQETTSTGEYEFLPCGDNLVANNIFYFERGAVATDVNIGPNTAPETFTFANNLWYAHDAPAASAPTLPVGETGAVVGEDPAFASGYEIGVTSPAASTGTDYAGLVGDMAGQCYGSPPSIGAYEAR